MTQRIAFFLRTKDSVNDFRRILKSFVAVPNLSRAVVTSGFYQEGTATTAFKASDLFYFPCVKRAKPSPITFVGVYDGRWMPAFTLFGFNVIANNCKCCVDISTRKAKGPKWHAKVFIGHIGGVPRFGIIGSSNLTRPAADTSKPFNFEADAVVWYESDLDVNAAVLEGLEPQARLGQVLMTKYDPQDILNNGRSVQDQLQALQDQILALPT